MLCRDQLKQDFCILQQQLLLPLKKQGLIQSEKVEGKRNYNAKLTLTESGMTIENGKLIIDDPTGHGIESNAKVELKSGAQLVIDKANYGIRMNGSGEFVSQTDSSVEITGSSYPVVAHGNSGITIGKLIATGTANSNIYVDTTGTVTIANATVTGGKQGVEMLKGTLNLSNSSFDKPAKIVANGKEKVLNLSGLIKGSILFNEAIPANVTGALTDGSDVTVDWAAGKAPADGIAINFAAGTMEASKKYIKLGSVQSATYLLHFTTEGGAEVGKLVDNIVKTEVLTFFKIESDRVRMR